jgi:GPH family glycoside/pentoside/hexuronide:cation symporter
MTAAPPLSALQRHGYGFGSIANGVKNAAFSTYLMLFYNQVVGVSASVVGTAIALTLIVDALVDPVIGRWSDVTHSRWGRRHPFIYASAVPTAFFFMLAWFPPSGWSDSQYGLWIFVTAMLVRMSVSFNEIPSSAMATELTDDYAMRTKLFSLRYLWGYAGAYGYTAFCLAVIFVATPEYPRGQLNPAAYGPFALIGAVLILLGALVSGLSTHRRIPYMRQYAGGEEAGLANHLREMASAMKNRAFLAIFGFGVLKFTAIGLYSATTVYFGTYLFKLNGPQLAILTFDSLIAAMIAAPLAPVMSRRMGKRNAAMLFAFTGICLGLSPLVLSYFDKFYLPGDPMLVPVLFVIGAVYGAMIAISLINTSSMLADVVEDSAVKTGRHTAGTFFAASAFMQQCSSALGIFMAGLVLTWSKFPAKVSPANVTEVMLDSLLAHYIPTVFCLWSLGLLFLLFYPINRQKHEANVARLQALEAEARAREAENNPVGGPAR